MIRRDWRQQLLVVTLLTLSVAAAIGFATAAYNVAPVPGRAEFGNARHALSIEAPTAEGVAADVAAAEAYFGDVDTIGHRRVVVPGRFEPIDFRDHDPNGPYGAPRIRLRSGRYPAETGEVAVTDGIAAELAVSIGASIELGGVTRRVVGVVENPTDLGDEFAFVSPRDVTPRDSATVLVDVDPDVIRGFHPPSRRLAVSSRDDISEGALAAVAVLTVAVVGLLFIALLAAAGFVAMAHRRRRQLGMLAAIGATERQVRLAMIANGLLVGAVAATAGVVLGVVGWVVAEPRVETAAGYRVDRLAIPWWVVVVGVLLAVVAATGAAWWPAWVAARTSIVDALSGRPASPSPVRRSAAVASVMLVGGVTGLAVAHPSADSETRWTDVALLVGGTVLVVSGILLLCPLALRAAGACAARLPVAGRIALRDLSRHRARSGAALAAIVMAAGIPAAVVLGAASAEHSADAGNLPTNQLLIRGDYDGPFVPPAGALAPMRSAVPEIAAAVGGADVTELLAAIDPRLEGPPQAPDGRIAVTLVEPAEDGWRDLSLLYVATPALLSTYGVNDDDLLTSASIITIESGSLGLLGTMGDVDDAPGPEQRRKVAQVDGVSAIEPRYDSLPSSFVTDSELRRRGWEAVGSGRWLLTTSGRPTREQLSRARAVAALHGLTVEDRDEQAGLARMKSGATAVGSLVALGVLAMTVGLIRAEAAPDLRTLTATGAGSTVRRSLTSITAASLSVVGAALGTTAAAVVLRIGFLDDLAPLPVAHLLVICVGTPLAAAVAGFVLAGREPTSTLRQAIA